MGGLVTMFSPDGQQGDIPQGNVKAAQAKGFKVAVPVYSPDGTQGYVPPEKLGDVIHAGGSTEKPAPLTDNPNKEGTYKVKGPSGTIAVPYSKVPTLSNWGYSVDPSDSYRYQKDSAQPGVISRVASSFAKNVGLPSNMQEARDAADAANPLKHPGEFAEKALLGPAAGAIPVVKGLYEGAKRSGTEVFKAGEASAEHNPAAVASHLVSAIPFVGPGLDKASDQYASGDYAGEFGTLLGTSFQAATAAEGAKEGFNAVTKGTTPSITVTKPQSLMSKLEESMADSAPSKSEQSITQQASKIGKKTGIAEGDEPVSDEQFENYRQRVQDDLHYNLQQTVADAVNKTTQAPVEAAAAPEAPVAQPAPAPVEEPAAPQQGTFSRRAVDAEGVDLGNNRDEGFKTPYNEPSAPTRLVPQLTRETIDNLAAKGQVGDRGIGEAASNPTPTPQDTATLKALGYSDEDIAKLSPANASARSSAYVEQGPTEEQWAVAKNSPQSAEIAQKIARGEMSMEDYIKMVKEGKVPGSTPTPSRLGAPTATAPPVDFTRPLPGEAAPRIVDRTVEPATAAGAQEVKLPVQESTGTPPPPKPVEPFEYDPNADMRDVADKGARAVYAAAKNDYATLDAASGGGAGKPGRWTGFDNQLKDISKEMGDVTGEDYDKLAAKRDTVEAQRDAMLKDMVDKGQIDPATAQRATDSYRQAMRMQDLGKQIKMSTERVPTDDPNVWENRVLPEKLAPRIIKMNDIPINGGDSALEIALGKEGAAKLIYDTDEANFLRSQPQMSASGQGAIKEVLRNNTAKGVTDWSGVKKDLNDMDGATKQVKFGEGYQKLEQYASRRNVLQKVGQAAKYTAAAGPLGLGTAYEVYHNLSKLAGN
jgi:hypothetical protein